MEPHLDLGRLSVESSLLTICTLALITHQLLRYLETYLISTQLLLLGVPPLLGFVLLKSTLPSLHAAVASFTTFFTTLLVSVLLYRISPFHPLAQYPGPFGCRLSKFWMAFIGYTGRQHVYIMRLHERYGDVVRIGPNELTFRDPSLATAMLGTPGVPKGPLMIGRICTATDLPMIGIMDPAIHAERRKPWNRAFSASAMKEYEPFIIDRASQLVRVLEAQHGEIAISQFLNYFTYDFMCDMAYGGGSELLRDGDTTGIWDTIEESWPATTFISHVPWLGPYCGHLPFLSASVMRMLMYCRDFTLQRIHGGSKRKDVFHYLNNEDQPDKEPPPVKQLVDDGVLAIVAGADTTSSALTSVFFLLATHLAATKRLQAEVDYFYPAGENACDSKHYRDMPYLTAVINEALRLYPPVPGGSQRQVPKHSSGVMLGSYVVPPGTAMWLHTYSIHRDPRHFSPFTDDFWPERWLLSAGRTSLAGSTDMIEPPPDGFVHNDGAFLPFSYGPANCVGKQLAMQEMRTVVCSIVQKFDVRLREGWDPSRYDEGFKDYFVTTKPALPVTLHARF